MEILKPYRSRINTLDEQIVELIHQRCAVINEVGHLKARNNIPAVIPERIDEVQDHVAELAKSKNLDPAFIREIYKYIIEYSCNMEEFIIQSSKRPR